MPDSTDWLIFLAQLPATPSSARVALWRRLRSAGALSLSNGAWVLPVSDEHGRLFHQLVETVTAQGGHAAAFHGQPLAGTGADLLAKFGSDRGREYAEFDTRVAAFLDEIAKECRLEKFTFAELEEVEDDFHKLDAWLRKIVARDFFADERQNSASARLSECRLALDAFAKEVYAHEGLEDKDEKIP